MDRATGVHVMTNSIRQLESRGKWEELVVKENLWGREKYVEKLEEMQAICC
jgi:hypothetical protein